MIRINPRGIVVNNMKQDEEMKLIDMENEIEEDIANMEPSKQKESLQKMYHKMKDKKLLKVGTTMDDTNIYNERKRIEMRIK